MKKHCKSVNIRSRVPLPLIYTIRAWRSFVFYMHTRSFPTLQNSRSSTSLSSLRKRPSWLILLALAKPREYSCGKCRNVGRCKSLSGRGACEVLTSGEKPSYKGLQRGLRKVASVGNSRSEFPNAIGEKTAQRGGYIGEIPFHRGILLQVLATVIHEVVKDGRKQWLQFISP